MTTPAPVGKRWAVLVSVAGIVIIIDQATKSWALSALEDGHVIEVLWSLQFRLAFNTGMSFSLGSGMGRTIAPLALLVVAGLLWMARRITNPFALAAVGLVAGGAIGNLIDRAVRSGDGFLGGAVVDFIDVQWWPVFNVADMGVVVGALLLLITTWFDDTGDGSKNDRSKNDGPMNEIVDDEEAESGARDPS